MALGSFPYNMIIRTRKLFVGPLRHSKGVCNGVILGIEYNDSDPLTVQLTSDTTRLIAQCVYTQKRQSGMSADNTYRHFITIWTQEGLHGHFFDVTVTKNVPSTGALTYHGVQLIVDQMSSEPESEFYDGSGEADGATTFVVEADASPEVDAYGG